jgi:hypothetical protein
LKDFQQQNTNCEKVGEKMEYLQQILEKGLVELNQQIGQRNECLKIAIENGLRFVWKQNLDEKELKDLILHFDFDFDFDVHVNNYFELNLLF